MTRILLLTTIMMLSTVLAAACGDDDGESETPSPTPTQSAGPPTGLPGVIAFVSTRDGNPEIYTMPASGGEATNITNNPAEDTEPSWSPDGARIGFQSTRDQARNIYIMGSDGSSPVRFRPGPEVQGGVQWAPDGTRIAFYTFVADQLGTLWVADVDGPDYFPLLDAIHPSGAETHCAGGFPGDWIDEETVLFRGAWAEGEALEICRINVNEDDPSTILSERGSQAQNPSLSPDGSTIAFTYRPLGENNDDIYTVGVEGRNLKRMTFSRESEGTPVWSPDGEWIAFVGEDEADAEIFAIRRDGTDLRRITDNEVDDYSPSWSPIIP